MLIDSMIALSAFVAVLSFTLWAVEGVGGAGEARRRCHGRCRRSGRGGAGRG